MKLTGYLGGNLEFADSYDIRPDDAGDVSNQVIEVEFFIGQGQGR